MKFSAYRLASRVSVSAMCLGMAVGCVNARDEYVDYGNRIVDADTTVIDGMIVSTIPDVTGDFFFAATPDLPEEKVFKLRVALVYTPVTENTGTINFSGQPLDFETDEPVGDFLFTATDEPVGSDASFAIPLEGLLPGRSNPVSATPANVTAVVHGSIITGNFLCGTLTGTAGGLDLAGSTWGSVRITGATFPPQVLRCADAPTE